MSTHVPGFQTFFSFFLHYFVMANLATSSIRVKCVVCKDTVTMLSSQTSVHAVCVRKRFFVRSIVGSLYMSVCLAPPSGLRKHILA